MRYEMYQKLKELCSFSQLKPLDQSILENISTTLFNPNIKHEFVHSIYSPKKRYGIDVSEEYKMFNENIKDFDKLGPNEKFLINKILDSPAYLLYIVGGIGVGKSSFLKFYIETILPTFMYNKSENQREPCVIFYDFLDELSRKAEDDDYESLNLDLTTSICDRIQAEIIEKKFFSIEEEVSTVWEELIINYKDNYRKNNIISKIITELSNKGAEIEQLEKNTENALKTRMGIREQILNDPGNRILYLALICNYIKENYYRQNPNLFFVVIDNVDRESPITQHRVKLILKPLANLSKIRVVVTARQTTYYQQLDDGDSEHTDKVPYCGVDQMEVIKSRVDDFITNPSKYTKYVSPKLLPPLLKSVKYMRAKFLDHPLLKSQYSNLCGHSIRKSLLLSQNLIDNNIYDMIELGLSDNMKKDLHITSIVRALYVGPSSTYTHTPQHIIENVYQVHSSPSPSYFIKIRILSILLASNEEGVKIKRIIEILDYYDYPVSTICDAINDMKQKRKRLIWSDSHRDSFKDEDELINFGNSKLFLSSSGYGYIELLFSDLNYLQEIMMDTLVDPYHFGYGWNYENIIERFKLLIKFISFLFDEEIKENELFFNKIDIIHNIDPLNHKGFYTRHTFEKINDSIKIILDTFKNNIPHSQLSKFSELMNEIYIEIQERIDYSRYVENKYFGE